MNVWLIAALALTALLLAFGFALASYGLGIRRQTLDQARAWQEEHYDISWYDGLQKQDYTVTMADGYALHAQLLQNPVPTRRYVLLSHGYTDNRFGSLKYARMYLDLGFNVILYDLRGHGMNEAAFCTYSIRESKDLAAMVADSRARYADMEALGLHGESLGSATSVACLKYEPQVDFVVADCGFSEIRSVMQRGLRGMHLPGCFVYLASLCARIRYGYFIGDMRPIDSLANNRVPILFMHGAADDFILPAHSQAMQKATKGYSELHLIEGAAHAASILTAPEEYRQRVAGFLRAIGLDEEKAE